jgi:hypothetical protein
MYLIQNMETNEVQRTFNKCSEFDKMNMKMINRTQNKDYNLKMYLKQNTETKEVQRTFYKCRD